MYCTCTITSPPILKDRDPEDLNRPSARSQRPRLFQWRMLCTTEKAHPRASLPRTTARPRGHATAVPRTATAIRHFNLPNHSKNPSSRLSASSRLRRPWPRCRRPLPQTWPPSTSTPSSYGSRSPCSSAPSCPPRPLAATSPSALAAFSPTRNCPRSPPGSRPCLPPGSPPEFGCGPPPPVPIFRRRPPIYRAVDDHLRSTSALPPPTSWPATARVRQGLAATRSGSCTLGASPGRGGAGGVVSCSQ